MPGAGERHDNVRIIVTWAQAATSSSRVARGWATNIRPELARLLVLQDPHPLNKFRVNGPLSNLPQFAAAFQCKEGDTMVRPEKDRCVIW